MEAQNQELPNSIAANETSSLEETRGENTGAAINSAETNGGVETNNGVETNGAQESATAANRIGTYELRGLLGRGGNAEVYKAWHIYLQRCEAIKVLLPHVVHDQSFVQRFLREARTAANLHHPHIATIFTVSVPETAQPYFTMELLEGGDVASLIDREGQLPLDETLSILRQVASALDYAHDHGVIHRDVKPANILLRADDGGARFVKVVDFGIARAQEEATGARLTKTGLIVGTPEYMSPEQAGSGPKVDHRTDVYSLGVVAYEMLCGRPPFESHEDDTALTLIMKHVREPVQPPQELRTDLSPRINGAILKALAKEPDERFNSCNEFVDSLGRGSASGVFIAPPMPPTKEKKARKVVVLPENATATNANANAPAQPIPAQPIPAQKSLAQNTSSQTVTPQNAVPIAPVSSPKRVWPVLVALAAIGGLAFTGWMMTRQNNTNADVSNAAIGQTTPIQTPMNTPESTTNVATTNSTVANSAIENAPSPTATPRVTPRATPRATPKPNVVKAPVIKTAPVIKAAPEVAPTPRTSSTPRVAATPRVRDTSSTREAPRRVRRVRRARVRDSDSTPRVRRTRAGATRRDSVRRSTIRRTVPRAPRRAPRRSSSSALPF